MSHPFYRVKQLKWALSARPLSAEARQQVKDVLTSAEYDLFQNYTTNDQQHAHRVLKTLSESERQIPPLAKAALLHDIGKSRTNLTVLDRCLIVLASRLLPGRAIRWGTNPEATERLKRAFIVRNWHAAWGADMAKAAGCDEVTCDLIRRHQDGVRTTASANDQLLVALQIADDQN